MEKPLRGPLTPVAPVPLTRRAERTMRIATSPPFALYGAFFVETSIKRLRSVSFLMFCLSDGNESASSSRSALSSGPDLVLLRPKTPCRGRRKPEQRRIEKVHAERTDLTPGQRGIRFGASALSKACVIHAKTDVPKRNIRFLSYVLDGYRAAFCPSPAVPAAAFAGLCALAGAVARFAAASGAPSAGAATVAAAGEAAGAAVGAASGAAAGVDAAADGSAAGAFSGAADEEVFSAAGAFGLVGFSCCTAGVPAEGCAEPAGLCDDAVGTSALPDVDADTTEAFGLAGMLPLPGAGAFCPSPAGAAATFAGFCALAGALAGLADVSGAPSAGAATVAAAGAVVGAASEVAAEVEAAAGCSAAGAFSGAADEEAFPAAGAFGLAGAGAFRFKRPDTSGNDGFPAGDFPATEGAEEGASLLFPASAAFSAEAGSTAGAGLADFGAAVEEVFPAAEDFGTPAFSAPVPALFPASDGTGALMSLSR